jgi:hypothetical protein
MQDHGRYEELCALAGVGQISSDELLELQGHLKECDFCAGLQSDFIGINALWLSQAQKLEPEVYDPQSALRRKILRNLQAAGAKFSAPLQQETSDRPRKFSRFVIDTAASKTPLWAIASAAVLVVGTIGFVIGSYSRSPNVFQAGSTASAVPDAPVEAKKTTPAVNNADLLEAQRGEKELQQKLLASEVEKARLQNELKAVALQITALQNARSRDASEIAQARTVADQTSTQAAAADAQVRSLKDAQSSKDAELIAAQYHLTELREQLEEQTDSIEKERQVLSAGSDLRSLIGARNLHIIDVADVDNGGTKKPFGRVFYTEGKSLIFYAFDLSGTKGKQAFYAWGHVEGDPHTMRALGALHNDDQAQKRWVFKFDDTKVLAQIDSVFVTLEPNDKPGDKPRGKKLMNAFLGTPPNHP